VHHRHILLSAACSVTILGAVVFAGHEPAQRLKALARDNRY